MAEAPQVLLVVIAGEAAGQRFDLSGAEEWTLGRSRSCSLRLPDSAVSRRHVRLVGEGSAWSFTDMDSENGVLHNGKSATRGSLADGDRLRVGNSILEVVTEERSVPATPFAATPWGEQHSDMPTEAADYRGLARRRQRRVVLLMAVGAVVVLAVAMGTSAWLLDGGPSSSAKQSEPLGVAKGREMMQQGRWDDALHALAEAIHHPEARRMMEELERYRDRYRQGLAWGAAGRFGDARDRLVSIPPGAPYYPQARQALDALPQGSPSASHAARPPSQRARPHRGRVKRPKRAARPDPIGERQISAWQAYRQGNIDKAIKVLGEAPGPGLRQLHGALRLAREAQRKGRLAEAVVALEKAITWDGRLEGAMTEVLRRQQRELRSRLASEWIAAGHWVRVAALLPKLGSADRPQVSRKLRQRATDLIVEALAVRPTAPSRFRTLIKEAASLAPEGSEERGRAESLLGQK